MLVNDVGAVDGVQPILFPTLRATGSAKRYVAQCNISLFGDFTPNA